MRAVAEHGVNGNRVDLDFLNNNVPEKTYKTELKFQFSRDFNRFEKYRPLAELDLEKRGRDTQKTIVCYPKNNQNTRYLQPISG